MMRRNTKKWAAAWYELNCVTFHFTNKTLNHTSNVTYELKLSKAGIVTLFHRKILIETISPKKSNSLLHDSSSSSVLHSTLCGCLCRECTHICIYLIYHISAEVDNSQRVDCTRKQFRGHMFRMFVFGPISDLNAITNRSDLDYRKSRRLSLSNACVLIWFFINSWFTWIFYFLFEFIISSPEANKFLYHRPDW